MQSRFVVNRDLFARAYIAQGDKEDAVVQDLHERIWLARVIYVMGPIAAFAAIQTPAIIYRADPQLATLSTPVRLSVSNTFARILGYLPAVGEVGCRETTLALNRRCFDLKTARQLNLHVRCEP